MLRFIFLSISFHLLVLSLLLLPWEKLYIPASFSLNSKAQEILKNSNYRWEEKLKKLWEEYERVKPADLGSNYLPRMNIQSSSNISAQFTDSLSEVEIVSSPLPSAFGEVWSKQKGCGNDLALEGVGLSAFASGNNEYTIKEVSPQSPAFKAGMKSGDIVRGDYFSLRGPKGSKVLLTYYRGNKVYKRMVKRQIICYKALVGAKNK